MDTLSTMYYRSLTTTTTYKTTILASSQNDEKLNTHSVALICERMDILIFVNSCYLVCEKNKSLRFKDISLQNKQNTIF